MNNTKSAELAKQKYQPLLDELDMLLAAGQKISISAIAIKFNIRPATLVTWLRNHDFYTKYRPIRRSTIIGQINAKKAQQKYQPLLQELDTALNAGEIVNLKEIANKHTIKFPTLVSWLKRNELYASYKSRIARNQTKSKEIEKQKVNDVKEHQKYLRLQKVAQIVFDLEDGILFKDVAKKNGVSSSYISHFKVRHSLEEKYPPSNGPRDVNLRQQAIELRSQGLSLREIATRLDVSKSSVHHWCNS